MENDNKITTEKGPIRYEIDQSSGEFYYSIVDIINTMGISKDPRNYWKVLKSRLKTSNKELVTQCNQIKLRSSDDKTYLTDVGNASTSLRLIQLIDRDKVTSYSQLFSKVEKKKEIVRKENYDEDNNEGKLSTEIFDEGEIQIDMFKKDDTLVVKAMIGGVSPDNIFISVNFKSLTIKCNRIRQTSVNEYDVGEISWGKMARTISLPFEVDIDQVEATSILGLLSIKFFILDKDRIKIIKVKS